jgi:hypothetical protein
MRNLSKARSQYAKFLIGAAVGFAVLAAGCLGLFVVQQGRPTTGGAARCALAQVKKGIALSQPGPKILLVGGSGVHQGLSADIMSQRLGKRVVNLGSFASLTADEILYNAQQAARPGDTVVLAFEYQFYSGRMPSTVAIDYALTCGDDYLDQMPLLQKLQFIVATPIARVLDVLRHKRAPRLNDHVRSHMSPNGDQLRERRTLPAPSAALRERVSLYRPMFITVDDKGPGTRSIARFAQWARDKDICVVATWPNTIYFSSYAQSPAFDRIRAQYRAIDVPVVGRPQDAMLDASMFYDTQYHLDIQGIERRTQRFVDVLKSTDLDQARCRGRL